MIFIICQNVNSECFVNVTCNRRRWRLYKLHERLHGKPRNCMRLCVNGIQTLETIRCAAHRMTVNRDYLTDSRVKTVTVRFGQSRVSCPLTPVADYT